jgi:O-antigen/teichoic acid export membrane protein
MASLSGILNTRRNIVVRSIGIYTFTNFFTKGISFLLVPLFTNPAYLTASDNGFLSLFNSSVSFLIPFISMGLVQSTSTDYFKLDTPAFKDFFTTSFVLPVLITILSVGLLFFCRDFFLQKFGFPSNFCWLIPFLGLLTFCNEQLFSLIRNNNEPYYFLGVGIGKSVVELGLAVVLIVFFQYHWQGRVIGLSTAYALLTFFAFIYFFKKGYLGGTIRTEYLKSELVYALPIIMLQLSIFVMSSSDKFFLADDHAVVGVYGIACTFASVILVLSTALLQYIFPKIFSLLSAETIDYSSIRKHFYLYVLMMLGGTIALMIFTTIIYKQFINIKYHDALQYVYLIIMGYFAWTITYFFYSFLLYNKQKRKILFLSVASIVVSLGLNYYFIRHYGAMGAAIAVCSCYFLMMFITIGYTRSYWNLFLKKDRRLRSSPLSEVLV